MPLYNQASYDWSRHDKGQPHVHLDESFSRKVEIEGLDYDLMQSQEKLMLPDLDETLRDLLSEMGEVICWAIEDQPWNGFITSLGEGSVSG